MYAAKAKHLSTVDYLLEEAEAGLLVQDTQGKTAALYIAEQSELKKHLMERRKGASFYNNQSMQLIASGQASSINESADEREPLLKRSSRSTTKVCTLF